MSCYEPEKMDMKFKFQGNLKNLNPALQEQTFGLQPSLFQMTLFWKKSKEENKP